MIRFPIEVSVTIDCATRGAQTCGMDNLHAFITSTSSVFLDSYYVLSRSSQKDSNTDFDFTIYELQRQGRLISMIATMVELMILLANRTGYYLIVFFFTFYSKAWVSKFS